MTEDDGTPDDRTLTERALRRVVGLSSREAAARTGLSASQVSRYRRRLADGADIRLRSATRERLRSFLREAGGSAPGGGTPSAPPAWESLDDLTRY